MTSAATADKPVDKMSDAEVADALEEQIALMEGAGKTHMSVSLLTMRKLIAVLRVKRK